MALRNQDLDEPFAQAAIAGGGGRRGPGGQTGLSRGKSVNLFEGPSIRRYSSPSRTRFCAFFRSNFFGSNFPIHSRQWALSGCRGVERASIMLK